MDVNRRSSGSPGRRDRTGRSSRVSDRLSIYKKLFAEIRHDPVTLLELGVESASSLQSWKHYFPSGTIIGADPHPGVVSYSSPGILGEVICPSDIEDLVHIGVRHGPLDVIIDNGSQTRHQRLAVFKTLFPFLKTGGLYIAAGLQLRWRDTAEPDYEPSDRAFVKYLGKLTETPAVSSEGGSDSDSFLATYRRHIQSVSFHQTVCVVRKQYRRTFYRITVPGPESGDISDAPLTDPGMKSHDSFRLVSHFSELGDRHSDSGAISGLSHNCNIEGFIIYPDDANCPPIEYRARLENGVWTDWTGYGQFAGTMGQGSSLTGFAVRFAAIDVTEDGRSGARHSLEAAGLFRGTAEVVVAGNGASCVPGDTLRELYGMEVVLRPEAAAPGPHARRIRQDNRSEARIYPFDPSGLQPVSKFIDPEYTPKKILIPATSEIRKPLPGNLWHDKACRNKVRRRKGARNIEFAGIAARNIDSPLLIDEMFLLDSDRLYLDTSIELHYLEKSGLGGVLERSATAIRASAHAAVDARYRDDVLLISHHEGGGTWGHYLIQSIPRMLTFLDHFPSGKIVIPMYQAEGVNGFGEALACYGISHERLAPVDRGVVYAMKQAVLLDFLFNFEIGTPHPKVLPLLRSVLPVEARLSSAHRRAFIKRRADAQRAIGNHQAVDAVMKRRGIDIYGPDELPLAEQIAIWQNHDLIVATLGSDLANIVYARPGTQVLVLSPHWFGDGFFFELSVAAGVRWHELRCGEMTWRNAEEERFSAFNVDTGLLDSILSLLLSEDREIVAGSPAHAGL